MKSNPTRLTLIAVAAVCALAFGSLPSSAAAPARTVEARIKNLHDMLKITPAEEDQWTPVAQIMRDNAAAMEAAIKQRAASAKTMTAVDDIQSYEALTAAHAEGLKKLAGAFAPLYSAMSEAQRKNADAVFAKRAEHSAEETHR